MEHDGNGKGGGGRKKRLKEEGWGKSSLIGSNQYQFGGAAVIEPDHHLLVGLEFPHPFGRRFRKGQKFRFEELLGILNQDH